MDEKHLVILEIPVQYLDYILQLQDIILGCDYSHRESLAFTRGRTQGIPDEVLMDLRGYRVGDLAGGYVWQIKESPEDIGFCFYQQKDVCLYVSNVRYLVVHHAPTGYAWGYNGSGPSDLGLNLAEWFARKHYQNLKQTELWRGAKASLLAYATHYDVRDLVNGILSQKRENPVYIPFADLANPILQILDTAYVSNLEFFQEGLGATPL